MSKDSYDNYIIKSNITRIQEFFEKDLIWQDIKYLGLDAIDDLHKDLESLNRTEAETNSIRGEIKRIRAFLSLETDLLESKLLQDESAALAANEREEEKENASASTD